ncbi:STAS domain-containing protein [Puniceicoccaceae bacterium K14]|nr:STAS domain-containing protein [Puniceicoccaceae bacterium K14]
MPKSSPVFLVDPSSNPVAIKVVGRATFQSAVPLKDFLRKSMTSGVVTFVVDFKECEGMDSTVLGVFAGCALDLRKKKPKGSLVLSRLNSRLLSSIKSLGLHRIATVDMDPKGAGLSGDYFKTLSSAKLDELENARICLEAHEKLIEADKSNEAKFKDVIELMRDRVDEA